MTNLITYTEFANGKLIIANANTNGDVQSAITALITQEQQGFLQQLMGAGLYNQFVTWYMGGQSPADPFYGLLNGLTFTHHNCTYNWVGLKQVEAYYIYYRFQEQDATQTVSGGEAKSQSQNAVNANSEYKMLCRWNDMVEYLFAYIAYMDLFYGTTGTVDYSSGLLPLKNPIMIQVDHTTGVVAGAAGFTFDGTAGTFDWRGYDIYVERVGQGTMVKNVAFTWGIFTGVFALLNSITLQPDEYFNITFSLPVANPVDLVINLNWADYRRNGLCNEVFHLKNRFGL